MRSWWTLRRQVAAACMVVAVLPGAAVAAISFNSLRTSAENQAARDVGTVADLQAERVAAALDRIQGSLDDWAPGTIAARGIALALDADGSAGLDEPSMDLLRDVVRSHMSAVPEVDRMYVVDNQDLVVFSSDPAAVGAPMDPHDVGSRFAWVRNGPDVALRSARSVTLDGAHVGHVILDHSATGLVAVSAIDTGLGSSATTTVAYRDGDVVRIVGDSGRSSGTDLSAEDDHAIVAAVMGRDGDDRHATDDGGATVLSASRAIRGTGWGVVVQVDRAEALASVDTLRGIFTVGAVGSILVAAVGAVVLSSRLTRPVEHLTATAAAIATGSDTRAERRGPRELSILGDTLNSMADALDRKTRSDPLTGLPNRLVLEATLAETVAAVHGGGEQAAVLFCDLDHFKVINDTRGHGVGDDLLVQVADRLRRSVRADDLVCRFGGDEFVIVLEGVATEMDLHARTTRIHTAFRDAVHVADGAAVHVSVSIGAASVSGGDDVETLLGNADSAMYKAKEAGRGQTMVFSGHLRDRAEERSDTVSALRRGLTSGEIEVHYQPIIDLTTEVEVAVEALVRWRRDEVLVGPDTFLDVAREHGLMVQLGDRVLAAVCHDLESFPSEIGVHVNVSVADLADPTFLARILGHLWATGADPSRLCLEVTEDALLDDENVMATLVELRTHGFKVAIDDFGTGYSSLGQLRTLPADVLKLDRSLVGDIESSVADADIVRFVIQLGARLGLTVVAEGVETQGQHLALRAMGCPQAQGWEYAAASPLEVLIERVGGANLVPPAGVEPAT